MAEMQFDQGTQSAEKRRYTLSKATQFIWLLTGILEAAIGIRILLKLMAANPNAGFAEFIYAVTAPFLLPFFGLTATPAANGAVLEIPSLIAMVVYAIVGWILVQLVWIIFDKPPESVSS